MAETIHTGHRERLREKCMKYGFDCLAEHEKLEYLLFPFIPRRDTNPIAHGLIAEFGSFHAVLEASAEALCTVDGMTKNAALFLSMLRDVNKSYLDSLNKAVCKISCIGEACRYACAKIGFAAEENLLLVCLDEHDKIIREKVYTSGDGKRVLYDREKLIKSVLACNAKYILLAHNHLSGNLMPSDADVESTNRLAQALNMVGVKLMDHIIVHQNEAESMFSLGCLISPVDVMSPCDEVAEELLRWKQSVNNAKM